MAGIEAKIGALVNLPLLAAAKTENDFVFLSNNFGEIDADVRGVDAPTRGVSRVVSDLCAVNHRFGRGASDVDAGSTQIFFLDERNGPPQIAHPITHRLPAPPPPHD